MAANDLAAAGVIQLDNPQHHPPGPVPGMPAVPPPVPEAPPAPPARLVFPHQQPRFHNQFGREVGTAPMRPHSHQEGWGEASIRDDRARYVQEAQTHQVSSLRMRDPSRPTIEVCDIRRERMTTSEAREELSDYIVCRFVKLHDPDDIGLGKPTKATWEEVLKTQVPGVPKHEAVRMVRHLNRSGKSAPEKKASLNATLQRQLEIAQEQLAERDRDDRFHYVLAQLNFQRKSSEKRDVAYHVSKTKKGTKILTRTTSRSKDRDSKANRQLVSMTAFFKRTPRPGADVLEMFRQLDRRGELRTVRTTRPEPPLIMQQPRIQPQVFAERPLPASHAQQHLPQGAYWSESRSHASTEPWHEQQPQLPFRSAYPQLTQGPGLRSPRPPPPPPPPPLLIPGAGPPGGGPWTPGPAQAQLHSPMALAPPLIRVIESRPGGKSSRRRGRSPRSSQGSYYTECSYSTCDTGETPLTSISSETSPWTRDRHIKRDRSRGRPAYRDKPEHFAAPRQHSRRHREYVYDGMRTASPDSVPVMVIPQRPSLRRQKMYRASTPGEPGIVPDARVRPLDDDRLHQSRNMQSPRGTGEYFGMGGFGPGADRREVDALNGFGDLHIGDDAFVDDGEHPHQRTSSGRRGEDIRLYPAQGDGSSHRATRGEPWARDDGDHWSDHDAWQYMMGR